MPAPVRIQVQADRRHYEVIIGQGVLAELPGLVSTLAGQQRLVVSTKPVWRHHGKRLRALVGRRARPWLMPDGESAKTLASASAIYDECARRGLDRSAAIIAFGGGVVGDVAGFAAATYLRGITLIQVPTTMLAQVDSSIGGKVGVNLKSGKNLVGSFHPPALVVCDPDVLSSLPRREYRTGLYEVVKYGVIASRDLFDLVSSSLDDVFAQESPLIADIVSACCRIKADVVMSDERESGPRRVLNFGHTVGHALEALTRYRRFRHGEAIAYGMRAAARLSVMRGSMSTSDESRLDDVIRRMGPLPSVGDLSAREALSVIARDKKVVAGKLHFVLAKGIGATEIVSDIAAHELVAAMRAIGMR